MARVLPSPVWTQRRAVKQGRSGGSIGTTYQGKRRECRGRRLGKTGKSRALGGERSRGTATYEGKGFKGKDKGEW